MPSPVFSLSLSLSLSLPPSTRSHTHAHRQTTISPGVLHNISNSKEDSPPSNSGYCGMEGVGLRSAARSENRGGGPPAQHQPSPTTRHLRSGLQHAVEACHGHGGRYNNGRQGFLKQPQAPVPGFASQRRSKPKITRNPK